MSHIMVDLETLSTLPNARIIAIGAVKFNPVNVTDKFYQAIALPEGVELDLDTTDFEGFHSSSSTLQWWSQQGNEARAVFSDPAAVQISTALLDFSRWAQIDSAKSDIRIWGNGASFDNVILSTAYRLCELEQPWEFWNDRCYRTAKNLNRDVGINRRGVYHNALDDADSQAQHIIAMGIL